MVVPGQAYLVSRPRPTMVATQINATLTVIENVFHYKQVLPLRMGRNVIGRYMKNSGINCPIERLFPAITAVPADIRVVTVWQKP